MPGDTFYFCWIKSPEVISCLCGIANLEHTEQLAHDLVLFFFPALDAGTDQFSAFLFQIEPVKDYGGLPKCENGFNMTFYIPGPSVKKIRSLSFISLFSSRKANRMAKARSIKWALG